MQKDVQDEPIMEGATEATDDEKRAGAAEQAEADRIVNQQAKQKNSE